MCPRPGLIEADVTDWIFRCFAGALTRWAMCRIFTSPLLEASLSRFFISPGTLQAVSPQASRTVSRTERKGLKLGASLFTSPCGSNNARHCMSDGSRHMDHRLSVNQSHCSFDWASALVQRANESGRSDCGIRLTFKGKDIFLAPEFK